MSPVRFPPMRAPSHPAPTRDNHQDSNPSSTRDDGQSPVGCLACTLAVGGGVRDVRAGSTQAGLSGCDPRATRRRAGCCASPASRARTCSLMPHGGRGSPLPRCCARGMTPRSRGPVVIDTGVFAARLTPSGNLLAARSRSSGQDQVLPRLSHSAHGVSRTGHGLAEDHEADRWVAATAIWLQVPLVAHDRLLRQRP